MESLPRVTVVTCLPSGTMVPQKPHLGYNRGANVPHEPLLGITWESTYPRNPTLVTAEEPTCPRNRTLELTYPRNPILVHLLASVLYRGSSGKSKTFESSGNSSTYLFAKVSFVQLNSLASIIKSLSRNILKCCINKSSLQILEIRLIPLGRPNSFSNTEVFAARKMQGKSGSFGVNSMYM